MPATMAKKRPKRKAALEQEKAVLYTEIPVYIKEQMDVLAKRHNRKLTGEVIQALQEYLAKYDLWPPPEEKTAESET